MKKAGWFNSGIIILLNVAFWMFSSHAMDIQRRVRHTSQHADRIQARGGDMSEVMRMIDSAIAILPTNPILWANKGLYMLAEDQIEMVNLTTGQSLHTDIQDSLSRRQAIPIFEQAVRLAPYDPVSLHNLGWLYRMTGCLQTGKDFLMQAQALSPFDPVFAISLGVCEESDGNQEIADSLYAHALALAPSLLDTPFFTDLSTRRPEAVVRILDWAKDALKHQDGYQVMAKLARVEFQLHHFNRARTLLDTVTSVYPSLDRAWLTLGRVLVQTQESPIAAYRKSLMLDPHDPLSAYCLGQYYETLGDSLQAVSWYREAVIKNRSYQPLYVIRSFRIFLVQAKANPYYPGSLLPWISFSISEEGMLNRKR